MKKLFKTTILAAGLVLFTGCLDDLNQYPSLEKTPEDVYSSMEGYRSVIAKCYASFVIAGQELGGGNPDINGNNNYDYLRCYFNLQECGTDEIIQTWAYEDNLYDLTALSWTANDQWVNDMYYRCYFTIALCNEFLRYSDDKAISKFSADEQETIRKYALEARFLRSLTYSHVLDLFGQGPFVTENDPVGAFIPVAYDNKQLFEFIESELIEIAPQMSSRGENQYGRAPKGAAYTLLAKLYLNAEVYTGTDRYNDCVAACLDVIGEGYSLEADYSKLFNADNHLRTNEIILPFVVDAVHTVSWGATTYIISGAVSTSSDTQRPGDYGIVAGWDMYRMKGAMTSKFHEDDKRGNFYTTGQSQYAEVVGTASYGYLSTKWTNLTDAGDMAEAADRGGVCTDYPMFRLAEVYLMIAESAARGAISHVSKSQAKDYVNQLRERAFGNSDNNISEGELTPEFVLDERLRELYLECTRRTDLIRYNLFTTGTHLWEWKGGTVDGRAVDSKYNIYPIPASDLSANPNLSNKDY